MAESTTFVNSMRERSRELHQEWNQFSRQIFAFLRSLQMQQYYMGGSPTYFKTAQDVLHFCQSYLAEGSSERHLVQEWIHLRSRVVSFVNDLLSGISSTEQAKLKTSVTIITTLIGQEASLVQLSRLTHMHLTEMEQRTMGGVVNLIPELLKTIGQILHELPFIRSSQLNAHNKQSLITAVTQPLTEQAPSATHRRLWSPQVWEPNGSPSAYNNVIETEFNDRIDFYHNNQSNQRGQPFQQWKLNYLRI
ncbi:uncharacterized protein LOC142338472 [Convolutriloba macropyga]|uniref:uncharacterized protein LOC142338472 n=1 Tax=Convolutriloba macropyga TaxID=536237 RepID=UPI003F5263AE